MRDPKPPEDLNQKKEEWYDRTRYQLLLFAVGIVLFVIVGALVLDWYIDPQTSTQKKDLVKALGLITAGVAGAVGIFFTWRGQRLAREAQEHNQTNTLTQLKNTQEQLEQTRRGQITERFTQAIDQLGKSDEHGKKVLETRMGAIYALARIARESKEDHVAIMEILTAYVRQHSPRNEAEDSDESNESESMHVTHADSDIQAILDVIGQRTQEQVGAEVSGRKVNLEGTDLRNSWFYQANVDNVWFYRADLRGTFFKEAHLTDTSFMEADLREADFGSSEDDDLGPATNLIDTDFQDADLEGADFSGVNLEEVIELTQPQIDQAIGDEKTRLPNYLQRPDHWVEELNSQENEE